VGVLLRMFDGLQSLNGGPIHFSSGHAMIPIHADEKLTVG